MKKTTNDWIISAESDLLLIQEIITKDNLTHFIAFHAQQSIEKSFKAVIEEYELGFFKTHSLETLHNRVKEKLPIEFNLDLLLLLDQLYIDARYPGALGLLPDGLPTITEANEFYELGKRILDNTKKLVKI